MANISPSDYIIGIIIFMMLTVGILALMSEPLSKDATIMDDPENFQEFNKSFNQYNNLVGNVTLLQTSIEQTKVQEGSFFGTLPSIIDAAWQTLKTLISSFGFMTTAFSGAATILGISPTYVVLASLIIITLLAFAIYQAIFRSPI